MSKIFFYITVFICIDLAPDLLRLSLGALVETFRANMFILNCGSPKRTTNHFNASEAEDPL